MLINCPFCGPRAENEFVFGGSSADNCEVATENTTALTDYLYFRNNPKGWNIEYWVHRHGCQSWLEVERHTVTHEIRRTQLTKDHP